MIQYRPTEVVQMHRWATVEILHTGSHCQKQDMENCANEELYVCNVTEYLYSTLNSRHLLYNLLWSPMNMSCEDKWKKCGITILNIGARADEIMSQALKCENYHWKRSSIGLQREKFFEVAPNTTTRDKM